MATVHFYEKPGCFNNSRQKQLLVKAGHLLIVHDLLRFPWMANRQYLRSFFGNLPVADWFNRSAPAIKNGVIVPELLNEREAIDLMIADPLLIRRPLMEVDGRRRVGFDADKIDAWLGLSDEAVKEDLETCPKQHKAQACQS
ncbi:MAG: ArsC/Spx/MgsR family protein [Gammaproteobacteria bacterium]